MGVRRGLALLVIALTGSLAACTTTVRVSVSNGDAQGNADSGRSALSADGRYVAFESDASNLVPGDTNAHTDVFVRDNVAHTTTRVSVGNGGTQANGDSHVGDISADGRYVVFNSAASNLAAVDGNGVSDVFLKDVVAGTTTLISATPDGRTANGPSVGVSVSPHGRYVAFESHASDLASAGHAAVGIYRADLHLLAQSHEVYNLLVTTPLVCDPGLSPDLRLGDMSDDGQRFVYISSCYNGISGVQHLVALELFAGGPHIVTTEPLDALTGFDIRGLRIAANGSVVVWTFESSGHGIDTAELFEWPWGGSVTHRFQDVGPVDAAVSGNGRYVAFESLGTRSCGDTCYVGYFRVLVLDRRTNRVADATTSFDGSAADGNSLAPAISRDGNLVGFTSESTKLVPNDTNGHRDVFTRTTADVFGSTTAAATRISG
jgi:Tol biopolymer transport system component